MRPSAFKKDVTLHISTVSCSPHSTWHHPFEDVWSNALLKKNWKTVFKFRRSSILEQIKEDPAVAKLRDRCNFEYDHLLVEFADRDHRRVLLKRWYFYLIQCQSEKHTLYRQYESPRMVEDWINSNNENSSWTLPEELAQEHWSSIRQCRAYTERAATTLAITDHRIRRTVLLLAARNQYLPS
jgi:hypothetical protein